MAEVEAARRADKENAAIAATAKSWLNRVDQLERYVEHNPKEKIPEFEFLSEREWLVSVDIAGPGEGEFKTPDDFRRAVQTLRNQAEGAFGNRVSEALRKYSAANNGQFPGELSQLQPFCERGVAVILVQLYEIRPASVLSPWLVKDLNIKTDWVITRVRPVNAYSGSHLAIFADGKAYWQSDR
jgi:hypothetical protein